MNKEELEQAFNETTDNAVNLLKENVELKDKINKAIEYIEENKLYFQDLDYDYEENIVLGEPDDSEAKKDLLKILKGEDK